MVATSGTVVNGLPHEDPPEVRINGATARKLNARNSYEHVDAHQRHQANGASGARAGAQGSRKSPKSRDKRKAECKHIVSSAVKEPDLLPADREARLIEEIAKMYHALELRELFVQKLQRIVDTEWPGRDITVHLFGSTVSDLSTGYSDVDICLLTDWPTLRNVYTLATGLRKYGMRKVYCVAGAKVPIVKLWDPELYFNGRLTGRNLSVDINVNNPLSLKNTLMVKTYVAIDPRVRPLVMVIKHWTKRRELNDAAGGGTLSTYTWVNMILHFLQLRKPPVLPALQQICRKKDAPAGYFYDNLDELRGFGRRNCESLAVLLVSFFKFYLYEFDYESEVVCLRLGRILRKEEKSWHEGRYRKLLCVEEPLTEHRNLGNSADDVSVNGIREEMKRAYNILKDTADLDTFCQQYFFPPNQQSHHHITVPSTPPLAPMHSVPQAMPIPFSTDGPEPQNVIERRRENSGRYSLDSGSTPTLYPFAAASFPPPGLTLSNYRPSRSGIPMSEPSNIALSSALATPPPGFVSPIVLNFQRRQSLTKQSPPNSSPLNMMGMRPNIGEGVENSPILVPAFNDDHHAFFSRGGAAAASRFATSILPRSASAAAVLPGGRTNELLRSPYDGSKSAARYQAQMSPAVFKSVNPYYSQTFMARPMAQSIEGKKDTTRPTEARHTKKDAEHRAAKPQGRHNPNHADDASLNGESSSQSTIIAHVEAKGAENTNKGRRKIVKKRKQAANTPNNVVENEQANRGRNRNYRKGHHDHHHRIQDRSFRQDKNA